MRGTLTGIDTFSYYYPLTGGQKDRIIRSLKGREQFRVNREDYFEETYDYASGCFARQGVKIRVHRKKKSVWGLYIIIHPALLLGDEDRSALYQPDRKSST